MDFTLSLADQQKLQDIVKGIHDRPGVQDTPGLIDDPKAIWAPFYQALYDAITVQVVSYAPDGSYYSTEQPAAGVDRAVWVWIKGAISVNSGTGALGNYIRAYTGAQYQERTGTAVSADALQDASNRIARNVYNTIQDNSWNIPDLRTIGQNDAAGAAAAVFTGSASSDGKDNSSPWAGTVSFADLGDDSFFTNWVLTNGTNDGKQEAGTYDLVSIAAAVAQTKTLGLLGSILLDGQLGLAQETRTLGASATADAIAKTHDFLVNTYGNAVSSIDIGDPIFSLSSSLTTSTDQFRVGTLKGQSIDVQRANQVVVGGPGDDTFIVADAPGAPTLKYTLRLLDGGAGQNTLKYTTQMGLTASLQKIQREAAADDPAYQQAPTTELQVSTEGQPSGLEDVPGAVTYQSGGIDHDYNFQHVVLGSANDTFSVGPGLTEKDLQNPDGTPTLTSLDGGDGIDTLDLSNLALSKPKTLAVDGQQVSFGGVGITGDTLDATGTQLANFEVLKGTDKGDYVAGATEFKNIDLGNGNNYVKDVSGPVLPKDAGNEARGHWVLIDLGSGSSTVEGTLAPGSEITADAGHQGDRIEISPDTRLHGLNPTDQLTWGGEVLTGGVRNAASDDPYAYSGDGLIRYGINKKGDLLIQPLTRYNQELGWGSTDPSTYVAGYINGDAHGSANATARIYTIQVSISVHLLRDYNPGPGWLDKFFSVTLGNMEKAYTGHSYYAGVDPLVLDLGGKGIATSPLETDGDARFDINGDGFANPTGWIGADQGFLVHVDAAPDGQVTSVKQLFGSSAVDGFQQLALLDANHDGVIDASDPGWSSLRVWQDANGDHAQDPGELLTMEQAGVTAISLAATPLAGTFQQGNQIRATATFTRTDGTTGTIADVLLHTDNFDSTYLGAAPVSAAAAALPEIKGRGTLLGLRAAMTAGETQGTDAAGNPATVPSPLEDAVTAALAAFPVGGDMDAWRQAMLPVLTAWAQALPDPKPAASDWWTQATDSNGNPIQGALTERPDAFVVIKKDASGNTVVDDLEYTTQTVTTSTTDPATGKVTTSQATYGYWVFGSGRAVTDAQGNPIQRPTLDQARETPLKPGESWSVIHASELDFLERYMGEALPLGQLADNHAAATGALTGTLNTLNGFLDLVTLRFAVQAPALAGFFGTIQYNADSDTFTAKTDLGLAPMYDAIFAAAPADHDAAAAYLRNWSTVIADLLPSFDRGNGLAITDSFLLGNIVAGWEAAPGSLTLAEAADALGCDPSRILTGTDTIQGTSGGGDLVYVGAGVSLVQDSTPPQFGGKPETFVVGRDFGNVTIDQSEGVFAGQDDVLRFASLRSTDMVATRDGTDLVLATKDGQHTLRVKDEFVWDHFGNRIFFTTNFATRHGVNNIIFADGVTWNRLDMAFATAPRDTHDQLIGGTSGSEVLFAGPNDTLEGGGGKDIYVVQRGCGQDTIDCTSDDWVTGKFDTLMFGPGIGRDDLVFSRGTDPKDLLVSVRGTGDSVLIRGQFDLVRTGVFGDYWDKRIDAFQFADGSTLSGDELMPLVLRQEVAGTGPVYGFATDDTLDAGPGDRYVSGGDGNDLYVFGRGYGHQTFDKNLTNILSGGDDTVAFGPGITSSDLTVDATSDDLVIGIRGTSDRLTVIEGGGRWYESFLAQIASFYGNVFASEHGISTFTFADGTRVSLGDLLQKYLSQGSADGDTSIVGFQTDDTLVAGPGDRYLSGHAGSDTYVYSSASGNDTINDGGGSSGDQNTLVLSDLQQTDISVRVDPASPGDLVINILPTDKSIRVEVQPYTYGADINAVQFADGATLTRAQLNAMAATGTPGADTIYGTLEADLIDGKGGGDYEQGNGGGDTYVFDPGYGQLEVNGTSADELRLGAGIDPSQVRVRVDSSYAFVLTDGVSGDQIKLDNGASNSYYQVGVQRVEFADGTVWSRDQLVAAVTPTMITGTAGSDTLQGAPGPNVIDGLGGGDYEIGDGGVDTFVFNPGYGQLEIREYAGYGVVPRAVLALGAGIDPSQVKVQTDNTGYGILLTDGLSGDSIRIGGMVGVPGYGVGQVRFADGTTWNYDQLLAQAATITSTPGADTIYGTLEADLIDGQGGGDYEQGNGGGDTYVFDPGYGQLEVNGTSADELQLGAGIDPSQVQIRIDGSYAFILTDSVNGDQVKLDGGASTARYQVGVQRVEFADGTVWTKDQILAAVVPTTITGTPGSDTLQGVPGPDVIDGLGGGDLEVGSGGVDTLVFDPGYGQLEVDESAGYGATSSAVLALGAGIDPSQVQVQADSTGYGVLLTDSLSGDAIQLDDMVRGSSYGVVQVRFADGTTWSRDQLLAQLATVTGTSGADTLYGTFEANLIDGQGGDDYEQGNGGGDTYVFDPGYGQLEVNGTSADELQLRAGIDPSQVQVRIDASYALVLTDGVDGDEIKLDDGARTDDYSHQAGVQSVEFADGTVWSRDQLVAAAIPAAITGTSGSDTLQGVPGRNVIDGLGGGDVEVGSGGADTFVFNPGYGQLEVDEDSFVSDSDSASATLQLGAGIDPSQVRVTADGSSNLILTDGVDGDRVVLDQMLVSPYGYTPYGVGQVTFSDGTVWSRDQLVQRELASASSGADTLIGGAGADLIDGQGGDDYELGGGGSDTFVFNPGYGQLEVEEQDYGYAPGNVLALGAGIDPSQVTATGDAQGDLVLRIGGNGDQVTLDGQLTAYGSGVQQVTFGGGTTWSAAQLDALAMAGTPGADSLYGTGGPDLFDGHGGGDYEQGNGGDDTFVFDQGYGQLKVNETSYGQASLQLGPGLTPGQVQVKADTAGDAILTFGGDPGDQVTIDQMLVVSPYGYAPYGVGRVAFSDGTTWSLDQLVQRELASASSGNDTLFSDTNVYGGTSGHLIDGQGGGDDVQGLGGADTLVFDQGYGALEINEDSGAYYYSPSTVLKLGSGIRSDQLTASSDPSNDLILGIRGSDDRIKVDNMLAPDPYRGGTSQEYGLGSIQFADGTTWSRAQILALAGH